MARIEDLARIADAYDQFLGANVGPDRRGWPREMAAAFLLDNAGLAPRREGSSPAALRPLDLRQ
jgi:hypothetical protein